MWGEDPQVERGGYARIFAEHAIPIDAYDPSALVLFPEIDAGADVPEITDACWNILGKSPADVMCSSSRMVVKRKGDNGRPSLPARLSLTKGPDVQRRRAVTGKMTALVLER
jgi:hypothetical protein